jgi:hypothetical protein
MMAKVRINTPKGPRHYRMSHQIRHAERSEGLDVMVSVWTYA